MLPAKGTFCRLTPAADSRNETLRNVWRPMLYHFDLMRPTPLRRGRRIMVWQTRVLMDDGTLIAVAIQTQMVLWTWPGISPTQQAQPPPLP